MAIPSNALLARYLASECSADEVHEIARWAAEDAAHEAWLRDLRALWKTRHPTPSWDVPGMWSGVQRSMRMERRVSVARGPLLRWRDERRRSAIAIAAAAAGVLFLVGAGVLRFRDSTQSRTVSPIPMREYATARGQRTMLRLPDGSQLVLAPVSRVRIPVTFGHGVREVLIEGEAVFDVVHDTTRPFRVLAKHAMVQDLGTRFGVRAYAEDSVVAVAVDEGAVELSPAGVPPTMMAQGVVLHQGELGTLSRTGQVTTTRGPALADHLAWATGRLVLVDVPLHDVVIRLGRWYDVDIRLASPTISARRVTAAFNGESALEALQFIASFLDLAVTQVNDGYLLRPKK